MKLGEIYKKFDARCKSYSLRTTEILTLKPNLEPWQHNHLTEVLISDIWQAWSYFCRQLFHTSCRGSHARDGSPIPQRAGLNSWQRLGYEAAQSSKNKSLSANGHNNFLIRYEPTWGDLDVFSKILINIPQKPTNQATLLAAFGSFSNLKHLQEVRNACAHKNVETVQGLMSLSSLYSFSKLKCAPQVAWEKRFQNSEFAIELWIFEMNMIADLATSTS